MDKKAFLLAVALLASANMAHAVHDFVGLEQRRAEAWHKAQDPEERQIFELEARRKWGAATNAWKKRFEEFGSVRQPRPAFREARERALFHYVHCMHQYAVDQEKPIFTRRAANIILQYEKGDPEMGGLKQRYAQLLKENGALRKEYEMLKKHREQVDASKPQ
jgi:hypothetical protein